MVESVIDLSGLNLNGQEADLSVLKGTPLDDNILSVESKIQVSKRTETYASGLFSFSYQNKISNPKLNLL